MLSKVAMIAGSLVALTNAADHCYAVTFSGGGSKGAYEGGAVHYMS